MRLPILLMIAFIVGVFFERSNQRDACATRGDWQDGVCVMVEGSND
nr:hypothetical protein [uncultured Ruegeria sp.]